MTFEVLINDDKSGGYDNNHNFFNERDKWASENCLSYTGMHIQDVSDVSYLWDEIAAYYFDDQKDQTLFILRWL
jgi:hypothetical protein